MSDGGESSPFDVFVLIDYPADVPSQRAPGVDGW